MKLRSGKLLQSSKEACGTQPESTACDVETSVIDGKGSLPKEAKGSDNCKNTCDSRLSTKTVIKPPVFVCTKSTKSAVRLSSHRTKKRSLKKTSFSSEDTCSSLKSLRNTECLAESAVGRNKERKGLKKLERLTSKANDAGGNAKQNLSKTRDVQNFNSYQDNDSDEHSTDYKKNISVIKKKQKSNSRSTRLKNSDKGNIQETSEQTKGIQQNLVDHQIKTNYGHTSREPDEVISVTRKNTKPALCSTNLKTPDQGIYIRDSSKKKVPKNVSQTLDSCQTKTTDDYICKNSEENVSVIEKTSKPTFVSQKLNPENAMSELNINIAKLATSSMSIRTTNDLTELQEQLTLPSDSTKSICNISKGNEVPAVPSVSNREINDLRHTVEQMTLSSNLIENSSISNKEMNDLCVNIDKMTLPSDKIEYVSNFNTGVEAPAVPSVLNKEVNASLPRPCSGQSASSTVFQDAKKSQTLSSNTMGYVSNFSKDIEKQAAPSVFNKEINAPLQRSCSGQYASSTVFQNTKKPQTLSSNTMGYVSNFSKDVEKQAVPSVFNKEINAPLPQLCSGQYASSTVFQNTKKPQTLSSNTMGYFSNFSKDVEKQAAPSVFNKEINAPLPQLCSGQYASSTVFQNTKKPQTLSSNTMGYVSNFSKDVEKQTVSSVFNKEINVSSQVYSGQPTSLTVLQNTRRPLLGQYSSVAPFTRLKTFNVQLNYRVPFNNSICATGKNYNQCREPHSSIEKNETAMLGTVTGHDCTWDDGSSLNNVQTNTNNSFTRSSPAANLCGSNMYMPSPAAVPRSGLRPIIIDGSNVAYGHGRGEFSYRGIRICARYFIKRQHKVCIFLPHYRTVRISPANRRILHELNKVIYLTPSRTVDNKLIASYDDWFIVQCASSLGGIVVSNDNYRDLLLMDTSLSETIKYRLLMYTWVGDLLMFPQDPLGKHGPTLQRFLHF